VDCKPIKPPYLKLIPLKNYNKMISDEKQSGKPSSLSQQPQFRKGSARSLYKSEYDDIIRSLQGYAALDRDLTNLIEMP
jgi:hypothetical protein